MTIFGTGKQLKF